MSLALLSLNKFRACLLRDGWKKIGTGYFSDAYAKGNLVWKVHRESINGNPRHFGRWHKDDFVKYADAILAGRLKGNELAPRIKRKIQTVDGQCAFLMERLETTWNESFKGPGLQCKNGRLSSMCPVADRLFNYVADGVRYGDDRLEKFQQLHEVLSDVIPRLGESFDLHIENIMFRRDGSMVILDPVFF